MTMWATFDRLFQSGVKSPVALAATAACALKSGDKRLFFVDRGGRWVNKQEPASFVSPTVHALRYSDIKQTVLDYWCRDYTPKPGDTVVDIGAGIGDETVIFSHLVGPTGRVISVEAHPETFKALQETIRRSNLTNVIPLECAIMDSDGETRISSGAAHLANSVMDGGDTPVRALTIASMADLLGLPRIDFLKMNIEGAERLAVHGLGAPVSHMAISCHDFIADAGGSDAFRTKASVTATLAGLGYTVRERDERNQPWDAGTLYVRK